MARIISLLQCTPAEAAAIMMALDVEGLDAPEIAPPLNRVSFKRPVPVVDHDAQQPSAFMVAYGR